MTVEVQSAILEQALKAPWHKPLHVQYSYDYVISGSLIKYDKDTFVINDCGWHKYGRKDENGNYLEMCLDGENPYDFTNKESLPLSDLLKSISDEHSSGGYGGYWTKGTWV